jgi:glycosyltransferase involved in cell wall biosynthesis
MMDRSPHGSSPGPEALLGLPFDLHERYSLSRRMVNELWPDRDRPLRILDVGGHSSPLKHLLPEDTVVLADTKPPGSLVPVPLRSDHYVQSSGAGLPFRDGSFDLVTAHDTLEHIPSPLRAPFVREVTRVSRGFVLVNGPVYSAQTVRAEEILVRLQDRLSLGENVFLNEHRKLGLPQRESIERVLESQGAPWVAIPNGRLALWLSANAAKDLAVALFPAGTLSEVVDRAVNSAAPLREVGGTCYRTAYVAAVTESGLEALQRLQASFPAETETSAGAEGLEETLTLLEDFIREAPMAAGTARQRELEARLAELTAAQERITHSTGYRVVNRMHRSLDQVAPWGTRRRTVLLAPAKAARIVGREGWRGFLARLARVWRWVPKLFRPSRPAVEGLSPDERYELWLSTVVLTPGRLREMRRGARAFRYRPRISVVLPVFDPEPAWLQAAIDSVRAQVYEAWELCIVDDGSSREDVREVIRAYEGRDPRIRVRYHERNLGISTASNDALALATGEFVGFLDHDDELKPNALYEVVRLLNERRDLDYIYSDEDKKELSGWLTEPFLKPGWSPDFLMSVNYVTHFSVYRAEALRAAGGFRSEYDGSQDYDLALRVTEATDQIAHIPFPLYSWRKVPGSAASHLDFKDYAYDAGKRALEDALRRRGHRGIVEHGLVEGRYRVRYEVRGRPRVRIIIPTRDRVDLLERCIDSIRKMSTYDRYDLVVVDNGSKERRTHQYLNTFGGRVVAYPEKFNYARMMNVAVEQAGDADFLLFLNNDTEVISTEWIEALVEHGQRAEVAAVGARLLFPSGEPQHEGIIVGIEGAPAKNVALPYFGMGRTIRNVSAVTAACMLVRPAVYRELGGFEERMGVAFNDVDFCLRAREKGYEIVYTPYALLYHDEGSSRGVGGMHGEEDAALFLQRWGDYRDPYYNPSFDIDRPFELRMES